jgi:hypothetical protein
MGPLQSSYQVTPVLCHCHPIVPKMTYNGSQTIRKNRGVPPSYSRCLDAGNQETLARMARMASLGKTHFVERYLKGLAARSKLSVFQRCPSHITDLSCRPNFHRQKLLCNLPPQLRVPFIILRSTDSQLPWVVPGVCCRTFSFSRPPAGTICLPPVLWFADFWVI